MNDRNTDGTMQGTTNDRTSAPAAFRVRRRPGAEPVEVEVRAGEPEDLEPGRGFVVQRYNAEADHWELVTVVSGSESCVLIAVDEEQEEQWRNARLRGLPVDIRREG